MNFERKPLPDADSTIVDWDLDSNPWDVAASGPIDPSTRAKIEEEIARKEKLIGHIEGYLTKNIAKTADIPDEEARSARTLDETLDKGYKKWSGEERRIRNRIAKLKEMIGEKDADIVLPSESRRNPVVVEQSIAEPMAAESLGFFKTLAKRLFLPYETMRSWFRSEESDGRTNKETPASDRNDHAYADIGENPFPAEFSGEEARPMAASQELEEPAAPASISKDPFEQERHARGTSESDSAELIEPDGSLIGSTEEMEKKHALKESRLRDAMGFSDSWKFGVDSEMSYEVEELFSGDMVRKAEELGAVYVELLDASRKHPRLRESYEKQSEIAKKSYADALGVARLTLAAELRRKPEEDKRKELMAAFASVVSKIRTLEDVPEERERKAA